MPMKPVDTAIKIILGPCIDDGDFKSREESLTYNQAGIEIDVILEKADGTVSTTAVTPTNTGSNYDWAHTNQGYYEMELPASGGASYNNDTEGILTVVGYCTGVLPFKSVSYDIVPVKVYNSLVAGSDNLEVDTIQWKGSAAPAMTGDAFASIGTPVAIDSGTATIAGMLTKMADDNGGATFDATNDSLNKIKTGITRATGAVVSDGGNTSSTFKTNLSSSTDNYCKRAYLRFTSGALINQVSKIDGFDGTSKFVTVVNAFTTTPSAADIFEIINN